MPPDQVACLPAAVGIFHHGLSVWCVLWTGVDNLLNHTLSLQGQVVVPTKKEAIEQDSVYNRLR